MLSKVSTPARAGDRGIASACLPPAAAAVVALVPDQCRWPLGEVEGAAFAFCPEPRAARSAYCAHHAKRARLGGRP